MDPALLLLLPVFAFVAGVPASTAAATLTATYNDLASVKALFEANKGEGGLFCVTTACEIAGSAELSSEPH